MNNNYIKDLINIYCVKNNILPAAIINEFNDTQNLDSLFEIIKSLKLYNFEINLQWKDSLENKKETNLLLVSKKKSRKNKITEKELGHLLGLFFPYSWGLIGTKYILGIFIKIDISKKPLVLYGNKGLEDEITRENLNIFIIEINRLLKGYSDVISYLKLNCSEPYVTFRVYYGNGNLKRKFNLKEFINQKKFKI